MIFIAEIGLNHNGNLNLCYELIRQAKHSGANIAKFQLGWRAAEGELNHITAQDILQLKNWCLYFQIDWMFSIITEEALELIRPFEPTQYKIASRTLVDNLDLAKHIINEGKPTFISLGMWQKDELPFDPKEFANIQYLYCVSKYPSTPWDMVNLPKNFVTSPYAGYSDHSIGIETALIAISRGAKVIEKHFTLDKSDRTIRDHVLSATPSEFRSLVNLGTDISRKIEIGV